MIPWFMTQFHGTYYIFSWTGRTVERGYYIISKFRNIFYFFEQNDMVLLEIFMYLKASIYEINL